MLIFLVIIKVIDTLKPSALVLEALSKHIQRNDEGVDEPTLKKWKSEFIKIAEEFDNLLSTVETTRKVLPYRLNSVLTF